MKLRLKQLINFVLLFFSASTFAEYRVYQYYVFTKVKNLNPLPPQIVTSTLDPKSYVAYHGGKDSIDVNLLRSWQCFGNTAKTPVCTVSNGNEFEEDRKK